MISKCLVPSLDHFWEVDFFSGNLVADGIAVGADSSIMLTKQTIQGWGLCYATIETLQR